MASRAATQSASPAGTTSGVVPFQTPRSDMPAIPARASSRTRRGTGQRSTPRQPRCHVGNRARPGARSARIHGRLRGRSAASWRRSTSTVRRSCRVTAKRSCPTRAVRRSAFSSETWAMPASPMATSAAATTIGHDAERVELDRPHRDHPGRGCGSHRHRAGRDVGHRPDQQPATDERGQPRRQAATRRQQRGPEAEAHDGQRERRVGQDPLQPVLGEAPTGELPGRGTGARRREGGEAQLAQRRSAQRGAPVDRGHEDVAHVGGLDRERPAAAARPQAHEERERGGDTEPGRARRCAPARSRRPSARSSPMTVDSTATTATTAIPTRYTWYSASIQWIFATRCRRRALRRSPMTETGTGSASGTTPRRAR